MTDPLTPEDKARIEAEERYRVEVREQIKQQNTPPRRGFTPLQWAILLFGILLILGWLNNEYGLAEWLRSM